MDVDVTFKGVLKRDIFVQGLLLKWQEKVLPSATTFADALHQARTAEEQEKQLGEMHHRSYLGRKESTERDPQGKAPKANGRALPVQQPVSTPPVERMIPRSSPRDRSKVQCYRCHGFGHTARECPLKRAATETRGSGGTHSGSSSAVTVERSEDLGDYCQRLRQEWVEAEFSRLAGAYCPEASVDTVEGALGLLFYATVVVAGTPVDALVDPGSSATIMLFELFKKVGPKAGIPREALQKPRVMLRDYSRRPIPVFAEVNLEFSYQGQRVTVPVYLHSDQGPAGEPCLLGTNVVLPLGLMVPGLGVQARELGVGVVRLIRAERVSSRCGVVVEALVEGCEGPVMVEPLQSVLGSCGLEMEHIYC